MQYADDTQVLVSGRPGDTGALISSMERNLTQLAHWFGKNGMKINAQQTQLIALGTRQNLRQVPTISIKFMGATVSGSLMVRNQAVVFDQCMTFTAHTDDVVRRCTGILIGLRHCRHSLPSATLTTLVQSLVVSLFATVLVYTEPVTPHKPVDCSLQKVLNFAARVISRRRKFDRVSDVLLDLQWLTARNLHVFTR